jgi:hypothetical protein
VTAGSQPFHSASTPSWRTRVNAVCTCRCTAVQLKHPRQWMRGNRCECRQIVPTPARQYAHMICIHPDVGEGQDGRVPALVMHVLLLLPHCCRPTMPGVGPSAFVAGCSCNRVLMTSA